MYGIINSKHTLSYPFVQQLYQEGIFSDLDLFFGNSFLKNNKLSYQTEEGLFFLLSFLMSHHRKGHICLLANRSIYSLELLWEEMTDPFMPKEEFINKATTLFDDGKEALVSCLASEEGSRFPQSVVWDQGAFYLQKNWIYERNVANQLDRLSAATEESLFDLRQANEAIEGLVARQLISPSQAVAIKGAFSSKFAMIYGGPGTGKTYVASHLISLMGKSFLQEERPFHVFVAAPTGKAASHLLSKVSAFLPDQKKISIEAITMHALLRMRKGEKKAFNDQMIMADIVIIDEASMVDMRLMAHLLDSLSERAHLVLLGDPMQLPPIEGGSPFADMVENSSITEKGSFAFKLECCMRTDVPEIMALSEAIKDGMIEGKLLSEGKVTFLPREETEYVKTIQRLADLQYSFFYQKDTKFDPLEMKEKNEDFRILSSLKNGAWGVTKINEDIFSYLRSKQRRSENLIVPIMVNKNDHRLKLYNGMLGYVICRSSSNVLSEEKAFFFQGDVCRHIPVSVLPSFDLAYCLSIHKSQGSEFKDLHVILPPKSDRFGRELLYTAVTRSRNSLTIIGNEEEIVKMVSKRQIRESCLGKRLF